MKLWILTAALSAALGGSALAAPPDTAFGPGVRVVRDALSGTPRALYGLSRVTAGATPIARAQHFLEASRRELALGTTALAPLEMRALERGHLVRFEQTALGLPVEGRSLAVKLDAAGRVTSLTSDLVPFELVRPAATIDAEAARRVVRARFEVASVGTPREVVLVPAPGIARVAWRVPVAVIPLAAHFVVWIDAENGAVLRQAPAGLDQPMTRLPVKSEVPR